MRGLTRGWTYLFGEANEVEGKKSMPDLVLSNYLVNDRCLSVQSKLNNNSRLRLYNAAHAPSPADVLATYTAIEANFDGYVPKVLNPNWANPVKVVDGQYQTLSAVVGYNSPVTTGNTLYGLFVDDGGTNLLFAMAFTSAITFGVGAPGLNIQVAYSVWSESLHP